MTLANEAMHEIATLHSVAALTQTMAQKIQAAFGYDRVCVALLEKTGLKICATAQAPEIDDHTLSPWQPEAKDSAATRVLASHQAVVSPISPDGSEGVSANTPSGEQRCELVLPLAAKGQIIGLLDIVGLHDPQDTGRMELLEALAGSLAIAVNQAQLLEATKTGQREARTLYSLSRQMTSLDLERIPERLLGQLGDLIPNDVAGLLVEIDGTLYSFFHISQPVGEAALKKLERNMLAHWPALTLAAPAVTPIQRHVQNTDNVLPDNTPALRSDIYALLFVGEQPLGALTVARTGPMKFEEADQHLLSTIANQVATAIENALLYRKLKAYAASLEQRVVERTVEIARQKERTEAILHSVADAVFVTDPQGKIVLTNERAGHLLDGQLRAEDQEYLLSRVREWGLRASEGVEEITDAVPGGTAARKHTPGESNRESTRSLAAGCWSGTDHSSTRRASGLAGESGRDSPADGCGQGLASGNPIPTHSSPGQRRPQPDHPSVEQPDRQRHKLHSIGRRDHRPAGDSRGRRLPVCHHHRRR